MHSAHVHYNNHRSAGYPASDPPSKSGCSKPEPVAAAAAGYASSVAEPVINRFPAIEPPPPPVYPEPVTTAGYPAKEPAATPGYSPCEPVITGYLATEPTLTGYQISEPAIMGYPVKAIDGPGYPVKNGTLEESSEICQESRYK